MVGRFVFSGAGDGTARQWDAASGSVLASFDGHRGGVSCLHVGIDRMVRLSAPPCPARLRGAALRWAAAVWGLAQVTGSADGAIREWDLATGRLVATLHPRAGIVGALRFHEFALCTYVEPVKSAPAATTRNSWGSDVCGTAAGARATEPCACGTVRGPAMGRRGRGHDSDVGLVRSWLYSAIWTGATFAAWASRCVRVRARFWHAAAPRPVPDALNRKCARTI